ncbi:MAG: RNA-binding protein [Candidatus Sericytochromatia bacterium]|nr:RNA-binding protein [Candidatus Sericytochromatia bacterium]
MNIYVGYLPDGMNDEQLNAKFSEFGQVTSAKVIKDRDTGLSKGFGFVEMSNNNEGQNAIDGLQNWVKADGRKVAVNVAKEREARQTSYRY